MPYKTSDDPSILAVDQMGSPKGPPWPPRAPKHPLLTPPDCLYFLENHQGTHWTSLFTPSTPLKFPLTHWDPLDAPLGPVGPPDVPLVPWDPKASPLIPWDLWRPLDCPIAPIDPLHWGPPDVRLDLLGPLVVPLDPLGLPTFILWSKSSINYNCLGGLVTPNQLPLLCSSVLFSSFQLAPPFLLVSGRPLLRSDILLYSPSMKVPRMTCFSLWGVL